MKVSADPQSLLRQATLAAKPGEANRKDHEALREKCREFEAILVQSMFKGMRATVPDGGLLEKGNDRQIFEEMRDMEIARSLAHGEGIGIAEALLRQLQGTQEKEE